MQSRQIVAGLATIMVAAWTAGASGQTTGPVPAKPAVDASADFAPVQPLPEIAGQIREQTNRFRAKEDLAELRASEPLQKAADDFAAFMAKTGKYGHTADDLKPRDRVARQEYEACIVAENIGLQFSSDPVGEEALARGFVEGWKSSKDHRANLLDPDLTEIGVAVARSEKSGKYYAVQVFARPKSESIRVEIENVADTVVKYTLGDRSLELAERTIRIHELCRPSNFTFLLPTADDADRNVVERVNAKTRLVIQRDDARELVVVRSAVVERKAGVER